MQHGLVMIFGFQCIGHLCTRENMYKIEQNSSCG